MAEGKMWGVTSPRLLDPPTAGDHTRTEELQQFLCESHLSEDFTDSEKRRCILEKLREFVKSCVEEIISKKCQPTEAPDIPDISILTFGSYGFGVHIPSDDLEVICFGPPSVNCKDFFEALHGVLTNNGVVAQVHSLEKEKAIYDTLGDKEEEKALLEEKAMELRHAPAEFMKFKLLHDLQKEKAIELKHSPANFIKFKLDDISVVLSYTIISGVPIVDLNIIDDPILYYVDKSNFPGLDRCRVVAITRKLIPNIENFQTVLRYINFWARKKGLYSNVTGYLGGVQWAILVARVCQVYPGAIPSVLLTKFFEIYSQWFWPSPVMLHLIFRRTDLDHTVWHAPSNLEDFSHVMPIISPAYPAWNLSACVSESTLRIMKEHLISGNDICKKIEMGRADWSELCEPVEFFDIYTLYLYIDIHAKNVDDLSLWKLEVEPLWRKLIIEIEAKDNQTNQCHLCPVEYAYDDAEHHSAIFIGIKRTKIPVKGVLVTIPIPIDSRILSGFKDEITQRKKPGVDAAVSQFRKDRMPDSVRKLVSGSCV